MTIIEKLKAANGLVNVEEINALKKVLADTDYKAIKFAEGLISEKDYAPIKAEREEIRKKIRELGG